MPGLFHVVPEEPPLDDELVEPPLEEEEEEDEDVDEPPDDELVELPDDDEDDDVDAPLEPFDELPLGAVPVPVPEGVGSVPNCDEPGASNSSESFAPPQATAAKARRPTDESTRTARFMAGQFVDTASVVQLRPRNHHVSTSKEHPTP
jgi:hypothetical protein